MRVEKQAHLGVDSQAALAPDHGEIYEEVLSEMRSFLIEWRIRCDLEHVHVTMRERVIRNNL